jgi:endogenous inhibitor of DNA gyrase (YacG/DUF329 family)
LAYQNQLQALRENSQHLSEEDLNVMWQIQQEELMEQQRESAAELDINIEDDAELSYDALLNLGERIGDVRKERWALEAQKHIDRLPVERYDASSSVTVGSTSDNDSELKCLICQQEYEHDETLTRRPFCGHAFHSECVAPWLATNDQCPYCRKSIVGEATDN